eukprot:8136453-Alexandrium_andersonii.AAC.1
MGSAESPTDASASAAPTLSGPQRSVANAAPVEVAPIAPEGPKAEVEATTGGVWESDEGCLG